MDDQDRPLDGDSSSQQRKPMIYRNPATSALDPVVQESHSTVPKISRTSADTEKSPAQAPSVDDARAQRLLTESTQRFAAGTTYGSAGRQPQLPKTPPTVVRQIIPPAPSAPPPRQVPSPAPAPRAVVPPVPQVSPATSTRGLHANATPPPSPMGAASSERILFDVKPHHALRVLIGFWIVLALFTLPGIGFWLAAVGTAVAEWYTRTNQVGWPPDVQDVLVRHRLAATGEPVAVTEVSPFIPFRAMTIPELFGGALNLVLKNWPSLLGIPLVILVGFVVVYGAIMMALMKIMFSASSAMSGGLFMMSGAGSIGMMIVMMLVFFVLTCVLALPADAMLIALTVIATDKAVRGEPVRFDEVFRLARRRILPVCRLTLTFYAIFSAPEFLLTLLVSLVFGAFSAPFMGLLVVLFVVSFVIGILLSLSPIIVVVEEVGVVESLKRSVQLAKPAFGRLVAIQLLWAACVIPLMMLSFVIMFNPVLYAVLVAGLLGFIRTLQMLIYTDLRMRQENYDCELLAEWTTNMGREGLANA